MIFRGIQEWGDSGENYGEDPALAAALGAAYTSGVQEGECAGRKAKVQETADRVAKLFKKLITEIVVSM